MCIHATPAKLNNMYGINITATMGFTQRLILFGIATDRKIIKAGMATKIMTMSKNVCETSKVKTFPASISLKAFGINRWK